MNRHKWKRKSGQYRIRNKQIGSIQQIISIYSFIYQQLIIYSNLRMWTIRLKDTWRQPPKYTSYLSRLSLATCTHIGIYNLKFTSLKWEFRLRPPPFWFIGMSNGVVFVISFVLLWVKFWQHWFKPLKWQALITHHLAPPALAYSRENFGCVIEGLLTSKLKLLVFHTRIPERKEGIVVYT